MQLALWHINTLVPKNILLPLGKSEPPMFLWYGTNHTSHASKAGLPGEVKNNQNNLSRRDQENSCYDCKQKTQIKQITTMLESLHRRVQSKIYPKRSKNIPRLQSCRYSTTSKRRRQCNTIFPSLRQSL